MTDKPTAVVYVDGFNLYRRRLQPLREAKWLDLARLFDLVLPDYQIVGIEYFTALLRYKTVDDPASIARQQAYLRALSTIPNLRITLGTFRADVRKMTIHPRVVDAETGLKAQISVLKVEEKGSDVNLASRMVADALTGRCDVVVLLSNDSDHAGQLSMLINEFGKRVGLITPLLEDKRSSKQLRSLSLEFAKSITEAQLMQSQFPDAIGDKSGTIHRPGAWH